MVNRAQSIGEFTLTDSATDDSFTGGQPLLMQVQGTRTRKNGSTKTWTSRSTLANGSYWEGLDEQTVFAAGSFTRRMENFDEVTVTLAADNGGGVADWANADVLASQIIDMTQFS